MLTKTFSPYLLVAIPTTCAFRNSHVFKFGAQFAMGNKTNAFVFGVISSFHVFLSQFFLTHNVGFPF